MSDLWWANQLEKCAMERKIALYHGPRIVDKTKEMDHEIEIVREIGLPEVLTSNVQLLPEARNPEKLLQRRSIDQTTTRTATTRKMTKTWRWCAPLLLREE